MPEYRLRGAEGIAAVAELVRQLGEDRTVMKELYREIKDWGRIPIENIRINALRTFPKRGGLNKWVASGKAGVNVRRGARSARIAITAGRKSVYGRSFLRGLDLDGIVRHPVAGSNRQVWVNQRVPRNYLYEGVEDSLDRFELQAEAAVLKAFRKVFADG